MTNIELWPTRGAETGRDDDWRDGSPRVEDRREHAADCLPRELWIRRAAIAERVAALLLNRSDCDLLARYAEECYAEAERADA